ncbi:MAG: TRAP transporter substrate-binding protein [Parasporobacterium sp.]|nr:TRAP transporter substrate-binding protein [Parasporobacterium sp.]
MKSFSKLITLIIAAVMAMSITVFAADSYFIDMPTTGSGNAYVENLTKIFEGIKEKTEGRWDYAIYDGAQLGTEAETFDATIFGTYPFSRTGTAVQMNTVKDLNFFNTPFLFDNLDQAVASIPGLEEALQPSYEAAGLHLIALETNGFRQLSSNREIKNLEDMKGLKIRTMEAPIQIAIWEALGTAPTPVSFSELYLALQQGTVDAQENPLDTIGNVHLYEQQKYIYLTNHMLQFNAFVVNKDFWDGLSAEDQKIISDVAHEVCAAEHAALPEADAAWVKVFEDAGVTVETPSAEFIESCRNATAGIRDMVKESMGDPAVFDTMIGAISK